jgi:hypothetical protein
VVKVTLLVGIPLSLFGLLLGWSMHPGGGLLFIVALVPSVLLLTREIIPRDYFWLAFPFLQFGYYFLFASLVCGIFALAKGKPTTA